MEKRKIILITLLILTLTSGCVGNITGRSVDSEVSEVSCIKWEGILEITTPKGVLFNMWDGVVGDGEIIGTFYPIASFEGSWGESNVGGSFAGYDDTSRVGIQGTWSGFVLGESFEGSLKGKGVSEDGNPASFTGVMKGSCVD